MADDFFAANAPAAPPESAGADEQPPADFFAQQVHVPKRELLQRALAGAVTSQRPWAEVEKDVRERGYEPEQFRQGYQLDLARFKDRIEKGEQSTFGETVRNFGRNSLPFVSAVQGFREDKHYGEAVARVKAGKATEDDAKLIARYERLQGEKAEMGKTLGGQLTQVAAGAPAVLGEMAAGGAVLRGVGLGGAAAAPAAAPLAAAANPSLGAQFLSHAGRMAALTPLAPSMYLEDAARRNLEAGRDATNWRGFGPALGLGYANTLVLGSMQKFGSGQSVLGTVARKGALGVGEQQGVDVLTSLADEFLPKQYEMGTKYGVVGSLARGEGGEALKKAAVQMFTFSMFAGMHEIGAARPGAEKPAAEVEPWAPTEEMMKLTRERMAEIPRGFQNAVNELANRGFSQRVAGEYISNLGDRLTSLADSIARNEGRDMTRDDAREMFTDLKPGKVRDYAMALADSVPVKGEKLGPVGIEKLPEDLRAGVKKAIDRAPDVGAKALVTQRAMQVFAEHGRDGLKALVEGGRKGFESWRAAEDAKKAAAAAPAAPPPPSRDPAPTNGAKEVLSDTEIREIAKFAGLDARQKAETLAAKMDAMPGIKDLLAAARSRKAGGHPSAVPPAAPEAPKSAPPPEAPPEPEIAPPGPSGALSLAPARGSKTMSGEEKLTHDIKDATGRVVGSVAVVPRNDGKTLHVDWTGLAGAASGERAGGLGAGKTRELIRTLAREYPEAEIAMGLRAGGAHKGQMRGVELSKFREKPAPTPAPTPADDIPFDTEGLEGDEHGSGSVLGATEESLRKQYEKPEPVRKAAPVGPTRKAGESDVAFRNRQAKAAGGRTIVQEIQHEGGLRLQDVNEHFGTGAGEEGMLALARDAEGRTGRMSLDEMAAIMHRKGMIQEDPEEHLEETLLKAIRSGRMADEGNIHERKYREWEAQAKAEYEAQVEHAKREESGRADGIPEPEVERVSHEGVQAGEVEGVRAALESLDIGRRAANAPEAVRPDPSDPEAPAGATAGERGAERVRPNPRLVRAMEEQWDDISHDDRKELTEASLKVFRDAGVDLTRKPGELAKSRAQGGEDVPAEPELEAKVLHAPIKSGVKAGIMVLLRGGSTREAAKASGGYSHEAIRKAAVKLFGASPWKTIEANRRQRGLERLDRQRRESNTEDADAETRAGIMYGPTGTGAPAGGTPAAEPHTPAEIIAADRAAHGLPNYTESVPGRGQTGAAFLTAPGAAVTGKMSAQDIGLALHEVAHKIEQANAFPVVGLHPDVKAGFESFNYAKGLKGTSAIREGFAEWYRRRQTGDLSGLSAAEKAADEFAERWAANKGLTAVMDRTKQMFAGYNAQTAAEKFGALVSKTGEASLPPPGTKAERVKEYVSDSLTSQARKKLDDLYDFVRAERKDAEMRKARGLPPAAPGTLPSEVFRANRYRATALSTEIAEKGAFAYDEAGKQVILSKSFAAIMKDHALTPEEVVNGGKLDQYMRAKEAVYLADKGKPNRPDDQIELARAALKEFDADPDLKKRMDGAAKDVTEFFDATVEAMEKMGFMAEGTAANFKKANPHYTPNKRVMGEDGIPGGRGRAFAGEKPSPGFMKARTASGEEMIGLADAIADRQDYLAYVITKQLKDRAFHDFFRGEGHGDDVLFHPMELTEAGKKVFQGLRAAGLEHDAAWEHLEAMGPAARDYFTPESWPKDASRPSYVMMIDGKPVRARIGSRPLYELLTGTQGEGEGVMKVAAAISVVSRPIAQIQRLGFTLLSPFYHLHNLMPWRDAATFLGRTVSEKGFVKDVKDVYSWYGKSLAYYTAKLFGFEGANTHFKLYDEMMGRSLSADANQGLGSAKIVKGGWRGLYQRLTDVMSFGEKALHVAEMKNVWDAAGFTEARIAAEMKADPSGASPIPFALQVAALNAAGAVTHNYTTMGYQVRKLNEGWPFLGVHIASAYKDIQTARQRPLIALRGLSVLMAAKAIEWALYHDDDEYKQLSAHRRDGFIFKTPVGYIGMPGPRGIQTPLLGLMDESLRMASDSNPRFDTLLARTLEHVAPSGGPAGLTTAGELLANRTRGGFPIVPKWQEGLPDSEKNLQYRLPYAASQLTGGIVPAQQLAEGGYNPLKGLALPPQHESVTRLRDAVEEMQGDQLAAKRRGERYPDANRLKRLEGALDRINRMSGKAHKEGTSLDPAEVNRRQVEIAKAAMGAG